MRNHLSALYILMAGLLIISCKQHKVDQEQVTGTSQMLTAEDILGNPDYPAMAYGGYRETSRDLQPSLADLREDLRILSAMGVKILRTYNVHLPQAANLLKAIRQMKTEEPGFEMYVMLGAWIDCKNAWTDNVPDHSQESERNAVEIATAVSLANEYPDIVKVLAVGNEAMVKWATSYYVEPRIILKWVNYLQGLKQTGELPSELWITSSDDFSSWGGDDPAYHTEELAALVEAVDYISMHTYPFHNTHYNPKFWWVPEDEIDQSGPDKIDAAMKRALDFARMQYDSVSSYVKSLGIHKPIHIGETGWATESDGFYGNVASRAADEYKEALYYKHVRDWTGSAGISCFYFEAFDEPWKDDQNPQGSENHFGLFTVDGKAKYVIWELVDNGTFKGLSRSGNPILKTYDGNTELMMADVRVPPVQAEHTTAHQNQ